MEPKMESSTLASTTSTQTEKARAFVSTVKKMAERQNLNLFIVTDGASATLNKGNLAVRNAREAHIKWELEHGFDPNEEYGD